MITRIVVVAAIAIAIASAGAFAGGLTWPFGEPGTFGSGALDQSKTLTIIVLDPTATQPGNTGIPPRAPMTGF